MHKIKKLTLFSLFLFVSAYSFIWADDSDIQEDSDSLYEEDDSMMDFDSLFDDAQDTEVEEEAEAPTIKSSSSSGGGWNLPINFYGSFSAEVAYSEAINHRSGDVRIPGAYAIGTFGIVFTPSSSLRIYSSVAATLPYSSFYLNTFYIDYNVFDKVFLTIGKITHSWGNSSIYDTDILDDVTGDPPIMAKALIPLPKGASIEAFVSMASMTVAKTSLQYAFSYEVPLWGFAFKPFARTWAQSYGTTLNDVRAGNGAIGIYITGDIGDNHLTFYGDAHSIYGDYCTYNYSRFVAGYSRYWEIPQKIGFLVEYQGEYYPNSSTHYKQHIGLEAAWNHVGGSRFTPAFTGDYDITNNAGVFSPGLSISDVLPHASIKIALPMIYGNTTASFGDDIAYTLSGAGEGNLKVYGCIYLKLSASF